MTDNVLDMYDSPLRPDTYRDELELTITAALTDIVAYAEQEGVAVNDAFLAAQHRLSAKMRAVIRECATGDPTLGPLLRSLSTVGYRPPGPK